MAATRSAGLLMYRTGPSGLEVLLAHPGGPFWSRKDEGAWTLPKGECGENEDPLAAAQREFTEETGFIACEPFLPLGELKQKSGKRISAWACRGDCNPALLQSNLFEMEWPPRSGKRKSFPEIDRAQWFSADEARRRLIAGQAPFVDRLEEVLRSS